MPVIIEIREEELVFTELKQEKNEVIKVINQFTVKYNLTLSKDNTLIKETLIHHGIKGNSVYILLNNQSGLSRELEIPRLRRKQMIEIAKNELKMKLNLSSNHVVDIMKLDKEREKEEKIERILATAVPFEMIKTIEAWCKNLGLKIKSLETGTSTMLKVLMSIRSDSKESTLYLDTSSFVIRLYLFHDQQFISLRTLQKSSNIQEVFTELGSRIKIMNAELEEQINKSIKSIKVIANMDEGNIYINELNKTLDFPSSLLELDELFRGNLNSDSYKALGCLL